MSRFRNHSWKERIIILPPSGATLTDYDNAKQQIILRLNKNRKKGKINYKIVYLLVAKTIQKQQTHSRTIFFDRRRTYTEDRKQNNRRCQCVGHM